MNDLVLISVLGFIALAAILYVIGVYNSIVRLGRYIDKNYANLESFLKQRHDEIPKLVNACQAYMQHERGTLNELTELRTAFERAKSSEEKIRIENRLSASLGKLKVAVEAYPDLKASETFALAMQRFSVLETSINDQRQLFNDAVTQHNVYIKSFPPLLLAGAFGGQERSLLAIPKEEQVDNLAPFPLK
jgi:LemA protein